MSIKEMRRVWKKRVQVGELSLPVFEDLVWTTEKTKGEPLVHVATMSGYALRLFAATDKGKSKMWDLNIWSPGRSLLDVTRLRPPRLEDAKLAAYSRFVEVMKEPSVAVQLALKLELLEALRVDAICLADRIKFIKGQVAELKKIHRKLG